MLWYRILYLIEVSVGLIGCSYFLLTWWRNVSNKWSLAAIDAGGWVILLLGVFVLLFVNLWVYGLHDPTSTSRGIQALLIYLAVDAIVFVRLLQWRRIRREIRRGQLYGVE